MIERLVYLTRSSNATFSDMRSTFVKVGPKHHKRLLSFDEEKPKEIGNISSSTASSLPMEARWVKGLTGADGS